jgi:hypothetical protein
MGSSAPSVMQGNISLLQGLVHAYNVMPVGPNHPEREFARNVRLVRTQQKNLHTVLHVHSTPFRQRVVLSSRRVFAKLGTRLHRMGWNVQRVVQALTRHPPVWGRV